MLFKCVCNNVERPRVRTAFNGYGRINKIKRDRRILAVQCETNGKFIKLSKFGSVLKLRTKNVIKSAMASERSEANAAAVP